MNKWGLGYVCKIKAYKLLPVIALYGRKIYIYN